jgi:hypothetical protein
VTGIWGYSMYGSENVTQLYDHFSSNRNTKMDPTGNILLSEVRGMSHHLSGEKKTVFFQTHEHQSKIFWAASVN